MAITTARIQMRRGLLNDFDPSKMTAGEWAVSIDLETDRQIVYMCFSPGIVKRMGTLEDFEEQIREATNNILEQYKTELNQIKTSAIEETAQIKNSAVQELNSLIDNFNITSSQLMTEIENAKNSVEQSKTYISTFENELKTILIPKIEENALKAETFSISAENSKIQSENFANQSKRWAIGIDEEPSSLIDNSKYYSEEAKRYAEQAENTVGFGIATIEKAGIVKPDGVTITVAEDGTISGANKVDIATSSTVGVVKPSQDLTITPDGTLGINTLFSVIEERANIQSGDTWETVLAKINKNIGDLKPLAFLDKVTESYLDTLITDKINNAIQKSQIVNNTVTTVEGTVLDGRVGKNLQDQISNTNNFIFNKGENAQISNVDNAPFGISTAYSSAINSPYTFWSTILTTGQEMFSQQLALPWSYADKSLKYRVKDSGIWSEWNECLTKKSSSSKDLNYETFGLVYCDEATLNTPFKQKITGSTQGICLTGLYNLNKWNTQLFLGNGDDLFYRFATDKGYSNWRNVSGISNQNGVDIRTLDTGSYYITNGINTPQDYPHGYLTVQRLDSNWAFLTFQHPYGSEYKMFVTKQTEGIWQNWANIQVTV